MPGAPQGLVVGRVVWFFEGERGKHGACRTAQVAEVIDAGEGVVDVVFARTGDRLGEWGAKHGATYNPEGSIMGGESGTWCFPARS